MKFFDEARKLKFSPATAATARPPFRREKYMPKGGPDGRRRRPGGSIWAIADRNLNTLIDFRYTRVFRGQKGEHGMARTATARAARTWTCACRSAP
jgi:GTP-binding protein